LSSKVEGWKRAERNSSGAQKALLEPCATMEAVFTPPLGGVVGSSTLRPSMTEVMCELGACAISAKFALATLGMLVAEMSFFI
jgi:hypothetical protein